MIEDDTRQLELFLKYCYTVCESIRRQSSTAEDFYTKCELAGLKVSDKGGFIELYFNNLEKRKEELAYFNRHRPLTEQEIWVSCK